jgi:hypothetical protein
MIPSIGFAYDGGLGVIYNDNEFYKLQEFLNETSDDGTHSNGQRLNASYNPANPTTWSGISWTADTTDRRATGISWADSGLKGSLDVSGFTSLSILSIRSNPITSVDLSGDTALGHLDCRYMDVLTELDAKNLTALKTIYASECASLTTIDVSGCSLLETLSGEKSQISQLNLAGCDKLATLNLDENDFESLDVSELESLTTLYCSDNLKLTSLKVENSAKLNFINCSGGALTNLDASGLINLIYLYCGLNQIETLKFSGDTALEELECNDNKLTSLSVEGLTKLTSLNCGNNSIAEIQGLQDTELMLFGCYSNQIEELDVYDMPSLGLLMCQQNLLTSLDLSGCTGLILVGCSDNNIAELDVSDAESLVYLICDGNEITSLDLRGNEALQAVQLIDNKLTSIKAVLSHMPITLEAKGPGYVELCYFPSEGDFYANAVAQSGEQFINWTQDSSTVSTALKYELSAEVSYALTANFEELALVNPPSGNLVIGEKLILNPNQDGGTWKFDSKYLSREGNTFTGLSAGKTQIEYALEDETIIFQVTIAAASIPNTGQDLNILYLLLAIMISAIAMVATVHRNTKEKIDER